MYHYTMDKDFIIALHGNRDLIGGHYNVLSSFSIGLLRSFEKLGVKAYTAEECFIKKIVPNLTISFNVTGYPAWSEYLKNNVVHIMWNVDSIFYQNIEAIEQFYQNPNFILFNVSPSDAFAINEFFPSLKHAYFPHAVDLELWKNQNAEKEYDIVFLSSILDYEAQIQNLKQTLDKGSFDLLMAIYDVWLNAPHLSFWEIYQIFRKEAGLNFNKEQYRFAFKNLCYLTTFTQRAKMIESLKDYNVKVFGSGPWEKYAKGKVQYMGECDLTESIKIINKSKISLHCQPFQLSEGLHERILNASAAGVFVLSTYNKSIESSFGDTVGYFNLNNSAEKIEYYIKNVDEREQKALSARDITIKNHTWDERAKQIINLINKLASNRTKTMQ